MPTALTHVIFTTEEVAESPEAVATALMAYEPAGIAARLNVNGEFVTDPKGTLLFR